MGLTNNDINTKNITLIAFLGLFILFSNHGFSQTGPPNTLASFTAEKVNSKVKLKWSIDTELNVDKYLIERSINGIYFDSIAAQNSYGNSGNNATYVEFDNNPLEGPSFYRIIGVDYNADTTINKTIAFNNEYLAEELPIFNMYPNPYRDGELTIEFVALLSEDARIVVTDINGKTIHQSFIASDIITLKLNVSQGVYFVSVLTPSERLIQKLVRRFKNENIVKC